MTVEVAISRRPKWLTEFKSNIAAVKVTCCHIIIMCTN